MLRSDRLAVIAALITRMLDQRFPVRSMDDHVDRRRRGIGAHHVPMLQVVVDGKLNFSQSESGDSCPLKEITDSLSQMPWLRYPGGYCGWKEFSTA
jgi:hypothetical protein